MKADEKNCRQKTFANEFKKQFYVNFQGKIEIKIQNFFI